MLVNVHMVMKLRRMSFGSIARDGGKPCARDANLGSSSGNEMRGFGFIVGATLVGCGVRRPGAGEGLFTLVPNWQL